MTGPELKLVAPPVRLRPHHDGALAILFRFSTGQRRSFALALTMLILEAVAGVFQPYPIGYLVDFLQDKRPAIWFPWIASPQYQTIALLTSAYIVMAAVRSLGDSLAEVFLARAGRRLGYRIRVTLYAHLQRLSLAFHNRRQTGEMLRRVTSDVEQVETFIIQCLSDIAGAILILIGTLTFLFIRSWRVAVLAAVLVPVLSLISHYFSQRITVTARHQRVRESELSSAAQEMLTAVPVVQTFGQTEYEQERFAESSRGAMAAALQSVGLQARFSWLVGMFEAVSTASVVWLGIWLVNRSALSVGTLILFIMLIQNMFRPTRKIIKQWALVGKVRASVERVAEVLARSPSVRDLPGARKAPPFRGDLEFRGVTFAYQLDPEDASGDSQAPRVLDAVSFRISAGEVVALVGPSGAGKSTIAQLIPRLYDPQAGNVCIDGCDIRKFSLDSLRRQIGIVLQDTILFRGSVAHNIGYGRVGATRDEIVAAAIRAHAHEFIETMPDGYDTELSERATNLSGGQRQRLAIARAFVRDASILILDEPTTGLDAESSDQVLAGLNELMKGRTTLIIAHDLHLIQRAHRILMIRKGRIEETGTHAELVRRGGLYASLHARRFADRDEPASQAERRAEPR
jgi:ATP-binding cassette, subfamily B, bacterial